MTLITGEDAIASARLLVLRKALKLELLGLKRHGKSVYAIVKEEFNLRGSKQSVYDQFNTYVEERTGVANTQLKHPTQMQH